MADNIQLNAGSSGDVLAADEVGGAKWQRVKVGHGADGTAGDVSADNPLPVILAAGGGVNMPFCRYLDTVGDGTGTKNANGDYSSVQGVFRLAPGAGEIYRVARLVVSIQDGTGTVPAHYGTLGAALTNGVQVRIHNGSTTLLDITDGVPVKDNGTWVALAGYPSAMGLFWWAGGDTMVLAALDFAAAGAPLRLDGDLTEELQVLLDDNLTGLVNHRFVAWGVQEGTLT